MEPIVIIYGATGAIGSATAKLLYDRKHKLHLVGRNQEKLTKLGDDFNAGITIGDVNESDLFKRVNNDIEGGIGGIVYAVGTINLGSLRRFKEADFLLDFKVNAMGAAMAIQSALPKFKKNKEMSSIVLFSSVAAQKGFAMHASMGMAKRAINGLTRSLAAELAPKIRVNAIAPASMATEMVANVMTGNPDDINGAVDQLAALSPLLNRAGTAMDVANAALWLASDESGYTNGHVLTTDAGITTGSTAAIPVFSDYQPMIREAGKTGL